MSNQIANIPYSPEYLDLVVDVDKNFEDQKETIVSVAQGEFVKLQETNNIALLLKTVLLLQKVSPEVVCKTKAGSQFVLPTSVPISLT